MHFLRVFAAIILAALAGCKRPHQPGESAANPKLISPEQLKSDSWRGQIGKYLKIRATPLTGFYAFTRSDESPDARVKSESGENYYFPVVPPGFDPARDSVRVFAYLSPADFERLTEKRNPRYLIMSARETADILGEVTSFWHPVPPHILRVYSRPRGPGFGFKTDKNPVTVKLLSISGFPEI